MTAFFYKDTLGQNESTVQYCIVNWNNFISNKNWGLACSCCLATPLFTDCRIYSEQIAEILELH